MTTPKLLSGVMAAVFLSSASAFAQELPIRSALPGCQFDPKAIRDTIDFTLSVGIIFQPTPPSNNWFTSESGIGIE